MRKGSMHSRRLTTLAVSALAAGTAMLGVATLAAATNTPALTLTITNSATGTCDPSQPVCSHLTAGDVILVAGTGFAAGSLGSAEECNSEPTQPVIYYFGNNVPVSCTPIVLATINASGDYSKNLVVKGGTIGPPVAGTPHCYNTGGTAPNTTTVPIPGCTTSGSGATDAANYPCPPTAAQQAAGDECVLAIGDVAGDRAIGVILFGDETLQPCPDTTTTAVIPCTPTTTGTTSTTTTPTSSSTSTSTTTPTTSTTSTTTPTTSTTSTTTSTTSTTTSTTTTSTTTPTTSTTSTTTPTTSTTSTTTPTTSTTSSTPSTTTTTVPQQLTGMYELYCPGTPIGDIALNDVSTAATMTPANPASGTQFNLTGYQTTTNLPYALASAAASLGNPTISGTATAQIDASGATPATLATPTLNFNDAIPNPVPQSGMTLTVPDSPITVGPFTATSSQITLQEDPQATLTLMVSGNPLTLTCTAYPNNTVPTGLVDTPPTGQPIAPVIALAGGGSPTTTTIPPATTTTKAGGGGGTTTTANPVVAASSSGLAFTGPGSGTKLMAFLGALLVLFGLVLLGVVDAPRRMLRSLALVRPTTLRTGIASRMPKVRLPKVELPKVRLPQVHPMQRVSSVHPMQRVSSVHPGRAVTRTVDAGRDAGRKARRGTADGIRRGAEWLLGR